MNNSTPEKYENEPVDTIVGSTGVAAGEVVVIVSGYFGPLHGGHLDLIEGARSLGDKVCVIVNNNVQQTLKKGRVITDETKRLRIVQALRDVDFCVISIDKDPTVCLTLELLAKRFADNKLIFANGGDRITDAVVPETPICQRYGIDMVFDAGGTEKADSSTRLIQEHNL